MPPTSERIEDIKARADLVREVESSGVELKHVGNVWKANCPFHEERSASFTVYVDGHFHCYGCGKHGDILDYRQFKYGETLDEAKAAVGGIQVVPQHSEPTPIRATSDQPVKVYTYRDVDGMPVGEKGRFETSHGKSFKWRKPGVSGW